MSTIKGTLDNVVEETFLAYAFDRAPDPTRIQDGLGRVQAHYQSLIADPLRRDESIGAEHGLVLWQRPDAHLRWPLWAQAGGLAMATTGVPTGWESVVGPKPPAEAAPELAEALDRDPRKAAGLNAPLVVGLRNADENTLRVVNDCLGVGRLYEMRTDDGWVWSNRLGALPIFAGVKPQADPRGWAILAAAGWFLGDSTPIAGTAKVPAGTMIEVRVRDGATTVEHDATAERERTLVAPRGRAADGIAAAADDVTVLARCVGEAWGVPTVIDLSGGRDSRVSAAAAISGGLSAEFKTHDNEPGETDTVRALIAAAPQPMEHVVLEPETSDTADDLATRLRAIHLVHDGMRNPQEVRRPTAIPQVDSIPPAMSGHGGEIGHGFYYANRRALFQLRRGGRDGLMKRLMTAARRRHGAAREDAYDSYRAECDRVLSAGAGAGISGPALLDYFYLAERLPYRSGLGGRSGRYSACATNGFVRAAFDLKPGERLQSKLHKEVVARLVPEWKDVPFYAGGSGQMPTTRRTRIWEKDEHAAEISRMIEEGSGWPDMFEPDTIRRMWDEVRSGGGSADYEHVFYRLVWRVGYEEHLGRIESAATTAVP